MDKVKIASLKCGNYPEISLIFIKGLSFCEFSWDPTSLEAINNAEFAWVWSHLETPKLNMKQKNIHKSPLKFLLDCRTNCIIHSINIIKNLDIVYINYTQSNEGLLYIFHQCSCCCSPVPTLNAFSLLKRFSSLVRLIIDNIILQSKGMLWLHQRFNMV